MTTEPIEIGFSNKECRRVFGVLVCDDSVWSTA